MNTLLHDFNKIFHQFWKHLHSGDRLAAYTCLDNLAAIVNAFDNKSQDYDFIVGRLASAVDALYTSVVGDENG